jgi:hypothetical protein
MKTLLTILFFIPIAGFSQSVSLKDYTDMQVQLNKEWTLKYMEAEVTSLRRYTDAQALSISDAISKANAANDIRFASINEFRGQLRDQASTFITRTELWTIVGLLIAGLIYMNKQANERKRK